MREEEKRKREVGTHHKHDLKQATSKEDCEHENAEEYPAIHSLIVDEHPLKVDGEEATNTKHKEKDGEENPERERTGSD